MRGRMISHHGEAKDIKVGFSWTCLCFGFLVPLVHQNWKWCFIMLLSDFLIIPWFIWPFFYNRIYADYLYEQGYRPDGKRLAKAMGVRSYYS